MGARSSERSSSCSSSPPSRRQLSGCCGGSPGPRGGRRELAGAPRSLAAARVPGRLPARARRRNRRHPPGGNTRGPGLAASAGCPRPRHRRLQARAGQNRQRTTAANARVAVMVGLTLFNSLWVAAFSSRIITQLMHGYAAYGPWSLAAYAVLSTATVVLVWTAPRVSVVTGALAAAAAAVYYLGLHVVVIVPAFLQVLYLA